MGKPKQPKTKEERLQEGISLLRQLKETGIRDHSMSYMEIKKQITDWIQTGEPYEDVIPFPEYQRIAEVCLPKYNNRAADIRLRAN